MVINIDELEKEMDELGLHQETQIKKAEPLINSLNDSLLFYRDITTKLDNDKICFFCNKKIEEHEKFRIVNIPDDKIQKGVVGFCSVCEGCYGEDVTSPNGVEK